jgi:uncharacterized repeat protein (TIGR02543 family)
MVTIVFPDTVTYNGNNNTGGTIPVYSKYYVEGTTVIVIGNTGSLEKTGYTFDGWNTAADGTGIDYAPGETFVMGASDVTLYAKWTIIPTYILTLNADTGGSVNDVSGEYYEGTIVGINAIPDTGYQFVDWTINSGDAGCVADTSSKSTTVAMNEDMTLTANFCEPEDFFDFDKITGTITGYNTAGGLDVVIPRMIDRVLVEHIGDWAFNNNNLISVTIPDSVTTIGDYAFIQNGLRYLILGNSLTSIGYKTFSYNRLYEVTIPDSVTTISDWAFYHTELYKVTIPDNVTIGPYAFSNNDLTWITIGADVSINYYDYTMGDNKGFKDFYDDGGRIAGTYFFSGSWILWI